MIWLDWITPTSIASAVGWKSASPISLWGNKWWSERGGPVNGHQLTCFKQVKLQWSNYANWAMCHLARDQFHGVFSPAHPLWNHTNLWRVWYDVGIRSKKNILKWVYVGAYNDVLNTDIFDRSSTAKSKRSSMGITEAAAEKIPIETTHYKYGFLSVPYTSSECEAIAQGKSNCWKNRN